MKSFAASIAIVTTLIIGVSDQAGAGTIVIENKGAANYEIAMSVVAPGERTLTEALMGIGRPPGTLARDVPTGISWELLVWKRTAGSVTWTFSTAYTVGKLPDDSGRTYLLIDPEKNRVTQAVMNQRDPAPVPPLPPTIPTWTKTEFDSNSQSPTIDRCPISIPASPVRVYSAWGSGHSCGPTHLDGSGQNFAVAPNAWQDWHVGCPSIHRRHVARKLRRR